MANLLDSNNDTISSNKQERDFEEGGGNGARTEFSRKGDPLQSIEKKELMWRAQIKEHEPHSSKRNASDQRIVEPGQERSGHKF